jgi:tetracycline 7-halogenase / FADH2 O2-dependent halogenase
MFGVPDVAHRATPSVERDRQAGGARRLRRVRAIVSDRCEIAVIGSGFAGSLMARVLAVLGHDVVLLERGTHPRFAIGESSTPLANLSLERLARRYNLADCYYLSAHGRWADHYPEVRRGLKRGFTFYRHHPGDSPEGETLSSERLLVAASPNDAVSDTHWLRADVDHHFVRQAIAAGVDYRDRVEITDAVFDADGARLSGRRGADGTSFALRADFVIDASGPGGFLARTLAIPSGLAQTETRSAIVFSHFTDVKLMSDVAPHLPEGPYPEDWAAVHHLIDEGWMYSLRFDHGVTSAGFALSPRGVARLALHNEVNAQDLWRTLLDRYPTVGALFADAEPVMPIAYRDQIQHRLTRAAGKRWVLLPHAFAFVDPLFSTGIAWSLRAVERLALCFEASARGRVPSAAQLSRYGALLTAEADQIDCFVAGAYDAMAHFDLFAAHAMIYFATVSFAEARQRLVATNATDDAAHHAWSGFLGVGDPVLEPLPRESLRRLREITQGDGEIGTLEQRRAYATWVNDGIAPRNIGGFGDAARQHRYPVDMDLLVDRHALLGLTRDQLVAGLPALRGMAPAPAFD